MIHGLDKVFLGRKKGKIFDRINGMEGSFVVYGGWCMVEERYAFS